MLIQGYFRDISRIFQGSRRSVDTVNRGNFGENCPKWRPISQFSGTSHWGHVSGVSEQFFEFRQPSINYVLPADANLYSLIGMHPSYCTVPANNSNLVFPPRSPSPGSSTLQRNAHDGLVWAPGCPNPHPQIFKL